MQIIKRNGSQEEYDSSKIARAIKKSFAATSTKLVEDEIAKLVSQIERRMVEENATSVEHIQDLVEEVLMREGYFAQAKSYILYRSRRTELRQQRQEIAGLVGDEGVDALILHMQHDFLDEQYSTSALLNRFRGFLTEDMAYQQRLEALVRAAVELTSKEAPKLRNDAILSRSAASVTLL